MKLEIAFVKHTQRIIVINTDDKTGKSEMFFICAKSGGIGDNMPLPSGTYKIAENPNTGARSRDYYFALFRKDEKPLNDQFYDSNAGKWRDGVRLGYSSINTHAAMSTHGCVMIGDQCNGKSQLEKWKKLQQLIRSTKKESLPYWNNEIPNKSDPARRVVPYYPEIDFKVIN